MSKDDLIFKTGCTNMRLDILAEASEEGMCILAYLKEKINLRLNHVLGKCRVAPIRHTTIPKLEFHADQTTSTVATENKLDEQFDWRRHSSLN